MAGDHVGRHDFYEHAPPGVSAGRSLRKSALARDGGGRGWEQDEEAFSSSRPTTSRQAATKSARTVADRRAGPAGASATATALDLTFRVFGLRRGYAKKKKSGSKLLYGLRHL